uniref:protein-tyrosine-phosphatase n=1 Tax=Astyanax mexicanus TaxID=7994 RepID=A0A3B1KE37_ASTMX
ELSPVSELSTCMQSLLSQHSVLQKRVRVKLFSRSSPDSEEEVRSKVKRPNHSSPQEGAVHHSQPQSPDPEHHVLPVERVGYQELHCVSAQTVAGLITAQFSAVVEDFLIIDCRYPYEFKGGHIKLQGAVNLYTEHQIHQAFLQSFSNFQTSPGAQQDPRSPEAGAVGGVQGPGSGGSRSSAVSGEIKDGGSSCPRKLIVFHCEFSSERGPRCQYLRELDRAVNTQNYPLLLYPELYLLQGGYKHFYTHYPDLCDPCNYVHASSGLQGAASTIQQEKGSASQQTANQITAED